MSTTELTPMMLQYRSAKERHPDKILFFRMGDFYEMFFDDAKEAARLLGIALTSRSKGPDAIPMAGVPVKAVKQYLRRLLAAGKRVAICEQLEDPDKAKGLVERDIVRVVTPGTMIDEGCLDERAQLYLLAIAPGEGASGLAWVDLSTGEFSILESRDQRLLQAEIDRIGPAECLVPGDLAREGSTPLLAHARGATPAVTPYPDWNFAPDVAERQLKEHFRVATLAGFGIDRAGPAVGAAGALLRYLYETQRHELGHITGVRVHEIGAYLRIDERARRALEIVRNARGGSEGTLLAHMDRTSTAMGARLLKTWLLAPLAERDAIEARLDAVEELANDTGLRQTLREALDELSDLERLAGRLALGSAHGRDLVGLARSLGLVPRLREILAGANAALLRECRDALGDFGELVARIATTLVDDPPLGLKDGGLIRAGVSAELDELRALSEEGGTWLERFQASEIERTGIPNLRVGYNRVFGYYIEVTNAQSGKVPPTYVRKQTLKNAERYVTPELREHEAKVVTAQERSKEIEYDLFIRLREEVAAAIPRIQRTAAALAQIDVLSDFAHAAQLYGYVRPRMSEEKILRIAAGRHPVVEANLADAFVPNDVALDPERPLAIITGPNMAGKSTYIRQTAIIVLMAQAGSFVPAREARIGLVDRLFARVGAADDLYHGQSTFMVEMTETATIIHNATDRSLIILDEVGRGTSTFDGISIAWAVTEHIYERIRARTMFATHYHELTELALLHPGIRNLNVAVKEYKDEIVFLRTIVEGATDRSYGLHVARLAALPEPILARAREILTNLERQSVDADDKPSFAPPKEKPRYTQLDLFSARRDEILKELAKRDLDAMTPLDALTFLAELKKHLP